MPAQDSFGLDELRASYRNNTVLTLTPSYVSAVNHSNTDLPSYMNPIRLIHVRIPTAVQASLTTGQGSDHTETHRMNIPLRDEVIEEITTRFINDLKSTSTEDLTTVWDSSQIVPGGQLSALLAIMDKSQASLDAVMLNDWQSASISNASHPSVTPNDWATTVRQLYESDREESRTVYTVRHLDGSDSGPIEGFSLMSILPSVTDSQDGKQVQVDVEWDRTNFIPSPTDGEIAGTIEWNLNRWRF